MSAPTSELPEANELDALSPPRATVTLQSGTVLAIEDLKTRQFFKFLRILTRGAMPQVSDSGLTNLDPNGDSGAFATKLISLILLAIPEADEETIDFVRSMVKPAQLIDRPRNKQDAERNAAMWVVVDDELENPELDDLVTILEAVVEREAADIQALGKRLASLFKLAQRTGQLKSQSRTSTDATSSEGSHERGTSFRVSTDGLTRTSGTSASGGYVNVSLPSENGSTTPNGPIVNG